MKQAPFYVGQEVVAIKNCGRLKKDEIYTVMGFQMCKCGLYRYELAEIETRTTYGHCIHCGNMNQDLISGNLIRPIERTRTRYVIKEVEVASSIVELEKCKN